MSAHIRPESRRCDFPPFWSVPLMLLAAIGAVFYASLSLGVLGVIGGLVVIVWLQRKADVYVRARDISE